MPVSGAVVRCAIVVLKAAVCRYSFGRGVLCIDEEEIQFVACVGANHEHYIRVDV